MDLRNSLIKKEKYFEKNTSTDIVIIKGFSYNDPSVPAGWGIKFRSQGPKYPPKKFLPKKSSKNGCIESRTG